MAIYSMHTRLLITIVTFQQLFQLSYQVECFSSNMNIQGCGSSIADCKGFTTIYKSGIYLKESQEYLVLGGTTSEKLMIKNDFPNNFDEVFLIRYTQQFNPIYAVGINISQPLTYFNQYAMSYDQDYLALVDVSTNDRKNCFILIRVQDGSKEKSFSFKIFEVQGPYLFIVSQFVFSTGVIFFKYAGETQQTYSSYINGFQISFLSAFFKNLYQSVLAGSISGGNAQFKYVGFQGVVIDIPEPYYFSMGDPITKNCTILASTDYTFLQNVTQNITFLTTLLQFTFEASSYQNVPITLPNFPQMVDQITHRQLAVPTGILPLYQYALGDIATVVQFGECIYNQSCSDLSITYSVIQQNGSAIPSEAMVFSSSSRKLIISSLNNLMLGTYNLKFRCIIPDGFMSTQNFIVEIVKELGNTYNLSSNTTNYQPNYAPEFLLSLINKWTIRAGSAATFTLPDYYDINPKDKVTVSLETAEKHRSFFRIKDNKFIVFIAGFPELGDKEMIISLTDDHKPTPKTTKYRLTVSIMQSPFGQMQNEYIREMNVSSTTKPIVFSFNSEQGVKVQAISPEGIVKINFEKSLNLTNITYTTQQILKALAIKFDDPLIKDYNWNITDLQSNSVSIKLFFDNPLLISQDQAGTLLQIILLNPSLFVNLQTNNSIAIQAKMPPQIFESDSEFLKLFSQVFNSTLSSLIVTQAGAQILISQSLQIFWSFVNTQQIISHLPLLQINVPANLYYFFLLVVGSLKFDYLFSSALIQDSFDIKEDYPSYDENFRNFGYDSSLAIQNMGFNTFILLMSPLLVIFALTFIVFSNFIPKQAQLIINFHQNQKISKFPSKAVCVQFSNKIVY
eukprot:403351726